METKREIQISTSLLQPNVLAVDCPSRQVLDLIADKWTALIFAILEKQSTRFNELQRSIEGISQKMLTQTLRRLEQNGIVERKVTPTVPPAVEYSLSALGTSLIPLMASLRHWAEHHLEEVAQARRTYSSTNQGSLTDSNKGRW